MRRLALLALPLALAACNNEADAPDAPAAEETVAAEPVEEATLDLQADGINIPAQNGFEQLSVPFGSARAATEATLAAVLGEETGRSAQDECPVGPVMTTEYEGLTLTFQNDQFAGYMARAPYVPELTRAEMVADPMVTLVEGSTLGDEFMIGSEDAVISGLFAGEGDGAAVETLWAGANCIAR